MRDIFERGAFYHLQISLWLRFWGSDARDLREGCVLSFANFALAEVLAIRCARSSRGVRSIILRLRTVLRFSAIPGSAHETFEGKSRNYFMFLSRSNRKQAEKDRKTPNEK